MVQWVINLYHGIKFIKKEKIQSIIFGVCIQNCSKKCELYKHNK